VVRAVGRGKVDRRRWCVAETVGVDRIERGSVTNGERNPATQNC